jgi:hypothetical protein
MADACLEKSWRWSPPSADQNGPILVTSDDGRERDNAHGESCARKQPTWPGAAKLPRAAVGDLAVRPAGQ